MVLYVCLPGAQSNPTIAPGEKFALPGPNGAGETPLINFSCGIVNPTRTFQAQSTTNARIRCYHQRRTQRKTPAWRRFQESKHEQPHAYRI